MQGGKASIVEWVWNNCTSPYSFLGHRIVWINRLHFSGCHDINLKKEVLDTKKQMMGWVTIYFESITKIDWKSDEAEVFEFFRNGSANKNSGPTNLIQTGWMDFFAVALSGTILTLHALSWCTETKNAEMTKHIQWGKFICACVNAEPILSLVDIWWEKKRGTENYCSQKFWYQKNHRYWISNVFLL